MKMLSLLAAGTRWSTALIASTLLLAPPNAMSQDGQGAVDWKITKAQARQSLQGISRSSGDEQADRPSGATITGADSERFGRQPETRDASGAGTGPGLEIPDSSSPAGPSATRQDGEWASDWKTTKAQARQALKEPSEPFEDRAASRESRPGMDASRSAMASAQADLQDSLRDFAHAYETGDTGSCAGLVDPGFVGSDLSGNAYRAPDFLRAIGDETRILDRPELQGHVGGVTIQSDGLKARLEMKWTGAFRLSQGGQELIRREQVTTMVYSRAAVEDPFRLSGIFGDPLAGYADRRGRLHVPAKGASLDGVPLAQPLTIDPYVGVLPTATPTASNASQSPQGSQGRTVLSSDTVREGSASLTIGTLDFKTQLFQNGAPSGVEDIDFRFTNVAQMNGIAGATLSEITNLFPGLDAVTTLPTPPYNVNENLTQTVADIGRRYAVQTQDGKFAIFEITDFAPGPDTYTIRWRFQTNGTATFSP